MQIKSFNYLIYFDNSLYIYIYIVDTDIQYKKTIKSHIFSPIFSTKRIIENWNTDKNSYSNSNEKLEH